MLSVHSIHLRAGGCAGAHQLIGSARALGEGLEPSCNRSDLTNLACSCLTALLVSFLDATAGVAEFTILEDVRKILLSRFDLNWAA